MLFDSLSFIIAFVIFAVTLHLLRPSTAIRNAVLLIASYGFYATWSLLYVPFLFASTIVDYWVSRAIARSSDDRVRLRWLWISLAVNLSLLGWFKYSRFVAESLLVVLPDLSANFPLDRFVSPFVPLGISYFTFQTLSYSIDVYRRQVEPAKSLAEFALYVSFFPQLVAGPIVRAGELLPQLRRSRYTEDRCDLDLGAGLVILGLFQKIVLGDGIFRPIVERVFDGAGAQGSALDHWIGVYAFFGQIYCDFSGYSNMAVGMAGCLGISLPANFRYPFAAQSFSEFWRRWHMTLTRWVGSYLYHPLGGSRCGRVRSAINVIIVMALIGLWHGASWTFVAWGLLHAAVLLIERALAATCGRVQLSGTVARVIAPLRAILTSAVIGQSCVLFRAHDLSHAFEMLGVMYGTAEHSATLSISKLSALMAVATLVGLFVCHWVFRERVLARWVVEQPPKRIVLALAVMILAICLSGHAPSGYLYFQF